MTYKNKRKIDYREIILSLAVLCLIQALIAGSMPARAGAYEDWKDAVENHRQGRYDQAIALYTKSIDAGAYAGTELAQLYHMRGKAALEKHGLRFPGPDKKLLASAVSDLTSSIALDANQAETFNDRGAALAMMEEPQKAVADFSKAIDLNPNFFWPYNNRCLAYAKMGRKQDAIKDCRKAAQIDPAHWQPKQTLQRLGAPP